MASQADAGHSSDMAATNDILPSRQDQPTSLDPYLLGRSYFSSSRLNLSHFLWKQVLGFNIHPHIPTSGFKRIIDVATGTGIWPLDVASEYADCEVDGCDISLEQCSPKEFMPRIRKLGVWDLFQEPPEEMRGRYDVVHVRLVVFVVRNNNPRPLIANMMKLLKPGGWLQWDELDLSGSHLERVPGKDMEAPTASAALTRVQGVGVSHWASNLPAILEEEGLEKAHKDFYIIPPPWVKIFSDTHLMVEEEMSLRMPEEKKQAKQREIAAISEESKQGTIISTPLMVIVARKPLAPN